MSSNCESSLFSETSEETFACNLIRVDIRCLEHRLPACILEQTTETSVKSD